MPDSYSLNVIHDEVREVLECTIIVIPHGSFVFNQTFFIDLDPNAPKQVTLRNGYVVTYNTVSESMTIKPPADQHSAHRADQNEAH